MPSPALVRSEIQVESRLWTRIGTAESYDADQPLEVWICGTGGGARVVELPPSVVHNVTWSDTRGAQAVASFDLDRYEQDPADSVFWLTKIPRVTSEIQIVWRGQVVHWGPVVGIKSPLGKTRATITVADPQWYFGYRLTDSTEQVWSINRVKNPQFDQGFSQWTPTTGPSAGSLDVTVKETGTQSVLLNPGEAVNQTVQVGLTPSWRALARARVWVEAAAVGGEFTMDRSDLVQTIRGIATVDADTPRDQWTWLTIDVVVSNPGPQPCELDLRVEGPTSGGDIWVDRVELQASPESLGIVGGSENVPNQGANSAAAQLIATGGDGVNVASIVDSTSTVPGVAAVWRQRNDMFVSEALRSLSDRDEGLEFRMVYSSTTRAVEALALVGVEHAAADVTLRVIGGTGAGTSGNSTGVDVDFGVERPTSKVRARSEEGFFDEAANSSAWGGLVLEDVVQVPMGIGLRDLGKFANARLMDSDGLTDAIRLAVTDVELVSTLRRGDRVQVVISDGPDVINDVHRIESIKYFPVAGRCEVDVVAWTDPGAGLPLPRPAAAIVPYTLEAAQVTQGRRLFDVERRLANAPRNTDRLEDLLDVDVSYDAGVSPPVADGDVLTWDEASQRWVGAASSGGACGTVVDASELASGASYGEIDAAAMFNGATDGLWLVTVTVYYNATLGATPYMSVYAFDDDGPYYSNTTVHDFFGPQSVSTSFMTNPWLNPVAGGAVSNNKVFTTYTRAYKLCDMPDPTPPPS